MPMIELSRKLALGAGLAALCMTSAFAQEQAPAEQAPATTPAPADQEFSTGTEVGAMPQLPQSRDAATVGETYLASKSESWEQRCIREEGEDAAKDACQLYQLLKDGQGTDVAEFTIFPLPAGGQVAAGATVIVPLETLLPANLQLAIDGAKPKVYPYSFCTRIGCIARVGFTADEVAQLKKGAKAVMTLVPAVAPDQKVQVDLSLKGFTSGYDALKVPAQ